MNGQWGNLGASRFIMRGANGLRYEVGQYHNRRWLAVERSADGLTHLKLQLPFDSSEDARQWCEKRGLQGVPETPETRKS